jgi:hypothetical protein
MRCDGTLLRRCARHARLLAGRHQIPPAKEGTNAKGDRPATGVVEKGLNRDGVRVTTLARDPMDWFVWVSRFCLDFFFQLPSFSPPFLQLPSKPGVCVEVGRSRGQRSRDEAVTGAVLQDRPRDLWYSHVPRTIGSSDMGYIWLSVNFSKYVQGESLNTFSFCQ